MTTINSDRTERGIESPAMCAELDPGRAYMCDRPRGHGGDHSGFELPTVTIDEPCAVES